MRPGRLDRILYVGPPDRKGRVEILQIRTRTMSIDPNMNFELLADLVRFHIFCSVRYELKKVLFQFILRPKAAPVRSSPHFAKMLHC